MKTKRIARGKKGKTESRRRKAEGRKGKAESRMQKTEGRKDGKARGGRI